MVVLLFVQKVTAQIDKTPQNVSTGGLKIAPDYNRLQQVGFSRLKYLTGWLLFIVFFPCQAPSERSVALPNFVPPPPVRVATTV